jgi:hypothetical protein
MAKGRFDFDDMEKQLNQVIQIGGLKGVMGMLPGVQKMKSQIFITVPFHLFDDGSPQDLLCAHSFGPDISAHHVAGKVLQYPVVNDRIGIKDFADALQFHRVWVVNALDHERHLFLSVFAHFLGAPFFAFVAISIACTLFITTLWGSCQP